MPVISISEKVYTKLKNYRATNQLANNKPVVLKEVVETAILEYFKNHKLD